MLTVAGPTVIIGFKKIYFLIITFTGTQPTNFIKEHQTWISPFLRFSTTSCCNIGLCVVNVHLWCVKLNLGRLCHWGSSPRLQSQNKVI